MSRVGSFDRAATVLVAWGGTPLAARVLRAGQRFVLGPDSAADCVIPTEETRTVWVTRAGVVEIGSPVGPIAVEPGASERLRLGAVTLSVANGCAGSSPARFADRSGFRDLAFVVAALAYLALVVVLGALGSGGILLEPDVFARDSGVVLPLLSVDAREPALALDVGETWRSLEPELAPPAPPSSMLLPETPARRFGRRKPSLLGRHVLGADQRAGGNGARAHLAEGPIGNPLAPATSFEWTIPATSDAQRHPASSAASPPELASSWGYWRSDSTWDWSDSHPDDAAGPPRVASRWGDERANGDDAQNAFGNMFGPYPGDPVGVGLGAKGSALGGGGDARSVGLGGRGTLGHGSGQDLDRGAGVADSAGPFSRNARLGEHTARAPALGLRANADSVERVLLRNVGRLRGCLAATERDVDSVGVDVGVGLDGHPSKVRVMSAEVSDATRACIARVVSGLELSPSLEVEARVHLR